jgi:hypothetical protein
VGLRKPRTIITGIIITGTMVAVPSLLTGTIIALTGRGEVIARRQLVEFGCTLGETHSRYLGNTGCDCRANSKCAVVFADFVFGRLPKLHLRHV